MIQRFIELPEFSSGSDNPLMRKTAYKAIGFTDEAIVRALARTSTPATLLSSAGLLYRTNIETRQNAYNQIEFTCTYEAHSVDPGSWSWSGETFGGTVHITNSLETIKRYDAAGNTATGTSEATIPYYGRSIGLDESGNIAGTEIVIPAAKFNIRFSHPQGFVSLAWFKQMVSLTGKTNSTNFLLWAPGEVLFLGASGSDGSNVDAQWEYSFAMSENASLTFGGSFATVSKKGWEYAWVKFKKSDRAVGSDKFPGVTPEFVFVERVYEAVDLAGILGIY